MKFDSTREEGLQLKQYHEQLMVIHEHRGGQFDPSTSLTELTDRFELVQKLLGALPASQAQVLLNMHFLSTRLSASGLRLRANGTHS